MSIQAATLTEVLAARDTVVKVGLALQQFAQGSEVPGSVPAARVTEVDGLVADAEAALAAITAAV